jgi:hypothetical protein
MQKTPKYNLEYWCGKKKIETVAVGMTKGFCSGKKTELVNSGRFAMGKFRLKRQ